MIDKIEFTAKNLISNAGVLLLLDYTEEPENISRFLYNFSFKTTQMARDINFRTFKKLLKKKKLRKIVIDLDSRAVNVEGNQEGAVKGYHPHHQGNNCYHILMASCDELKAYITGFMRSGNTYTTSFFRMDSGYESEEIVEVIEGAGYQYVVKAKEYSKHA